MEPALIISVFALLVSLANLRLTAMRGIKPVLVIEYREETGWHVRNVGNGPALNTLVAQVKNGAWFKPVRIAPLGRDAVYHMGWLGHVNDPGIGVAYEDIDRRSYTSVCGNDLTRISNRRLFPAWPEPVIGRDWRPEGDSQK